jgi:type IV secretory pathway TraG/TraD family ATPase VirD4
MSMSKDTGGQIGKDVMVKEPKRSLSKTQHLVMRNLMGSNEIIKLAPDPLLIMRVGENPLILKKLCNYTDKKFAELFDRE